jgi:hypothetical protein
VGQTAPYHYRKKMMAYTLITPWLNQTYGIDQSNYSTQYARLAGKRFIDGTIDGNIPISLTDIPRGVSLLINGTTVTEIQTPSQRRIGCCKLLLSRWTRVYY